MTAQDVITIARDWLNDSIEPYRYEEDELVRYIDQGQKHLVSVRPDSMYTDSVIVSDVEDVTDVTHTLQVASKFKACLANYVCWQSLQKDAEHAANMTLSTNHYNAFMLALKGL